MTKSRNSVTITPLKVCWTQILSPHTRVELSPFAAITVIPATDTLSPRLISLYLGRILCTDVSVQAWITVTNEIIFFFATMDTVGSNSLLSKRIVQGHFDLSQVGTKRLPTQPMENMQSPHTKLCLSYLNLMDLCVVGHRHNSVANPHQTDTLQVESPRGCLYIYVKTHYPKHSPNATAEFTCIHQLM